MRKLIIILMLILSMSMFVSCNKKDKKQSDAPKGEQISQILAELNAAPMSTQAPTVVLPNLFTGNDEPLSQFEGGLLLISVWRSGCHYCQQEAPRMSKLSKLLSKDNNIAMLGISTDRDKSQAEAFVSQYKLQSYTHTFDPGGAIIGRSRVLEIRGTPSGFIITPKGLIIGKISGAHDFNPKKHYELLQRLYELTK